MSAQNLAECDGIAVRVQNGAGSSIAWLHGYTMDSTVWSQLWRLMPEWTHVGIDLPGHGASRPIGATERLDDLGRLVSDVIGTYGVQHLVGLSFGGTVALQTAIEDHERLRSLTLGAPALAGGPTDPGSERRYEQLCELYAQFGPGSHMTRLWMASPPAIFQAARSQPNLWRHLEMVINRHQWNELADGSMRTLTACRQTAGDLRDVRANTLVIIGEGDMPAFRYSAAFVGRLVPRCRITLVPRAGHLCLLERPEIAALLIAQHIRATEQLATPPPS
jgi:pimeloyl-ACP methyl ester carboxylesterase